MSIFEKRANIKPYEYPELLKFVDAIRQSYRVHDEFSFTGDIQDWNVNLTDKEKEAAKRSMLAISQIEVNVKTFRGNIYEYMPKPEIADVGYSFAESEVRHSHAYSHLIELLGLNEEFESIVDVPCIKKRIEYLEQALVGGNDIKSYVKKLLLFSVLIENISLFSQFLVMMSFNKYDKKLSGISNVVEATFLEENVHNLFGIELLTIIDKENPGILLDMEKEIEDMVHIALASEKEIIDRIFEKGEFEHMPKEVVYNFIKGRVNDSMERLGLGIRVIVDEDLAKKVERFKEELVATKEGDFFFSELNTYSNAVQSYTSDDLF